MVAVQCTHLNVALLSAECECRYLAAQVTSKMGLVSDRPPGSLPQSFM